MKAPVTVIDLNATVIICQTAVIDISTTAIIEH